MPAEHRVATLDGGLPLDALLCRMRNQPLPDGTRATDEQFQLRLLPVRLFIPDWPHPT
jgi:hypothetical protein